MVKTSWDQKSVIASLLQRLPSACGEGTGCSRNQTSKGPGNAVNFEKAPQAQALEPHLRHLQS